jgi:hypothetical protein
MQLLYVGKSNEVGARLGAHLGWNGERTVLVLRKPSGWASSHTRRHRSRGRGTMSSVIGVGVGRVKPGVAWYARVKEGFHRRETQR